jgi:hypothetical protein
MMVSFTLLYHFQVFKSRIIVMLSNIDTTHNMKSETMFPNIFPIGLSQLLSASPLLRNLGISRGEGALTMEFPADTREGVILT